MSFMSRLRGLFSKESHFEVYREEFFRRVEAVRIKEPSAEELIDGQAFAIKHYKMKHPVVLVAGDTITGSITEDHEPVASVTEAVDRTMRVNTISSIRFNDSLGFKHAVGIIFGERNWVGDTPDDAGYRGGKVNNDERQTHHNQNDG